ncbi:Aminomethyltransferase folate-binding domain-containing protein [Desulfacinum hydrothermale DSM 13146]|uniref:Aminomethyltransferase folate-binding domain-containing protein n=1 Tax=Desulfacinum hydrothermale DSM 13146 TaxID=1121390 RepID=A0A1W1XGB7_9BACT|nr:hypothetical protein [Desulfacinum hydrothermale]SMC23046.1 Aminomethyltransferase folate-binding domain-containing protein [Desulfacinum hydrothermale DSM 13146]
MQEAYRHPPLTLPGTPVQEEVRDGWKVTIRFREEGNGPWLVDLSHVAKLDIQDPGLDRTPGLEGLIPEKPGASALHEGWIISRLNEVQASLWQLRPQAPPLHPRGEWVTDVTDGLALLALAGPQTLDVMERVTSLDLGRSGQPCPSVFQGPVCRVPTQVVLLRNDGSWAVVFLAFARGYGQCVAEALLHAGRPLGLGPAGEERLVSILDEP